ncbi:MAG: hypothetical protein IJB71_04685 [Bacilli bacterium]|nr:hypothetical protein [Bacilli bacterium]
MKFDLNNVFLQAKANDHDATALIIEYFMTKVESQLKNINVSSEAYAEKYNMCLETIIENLKRYYESRRFLEETLKNIKEIIYLNKKPVKFNSKDLVQESESFIRARIIAGDLGFFDIPIVYKECARLYYINGISPDDLAIICKCSVTVIYKRLRAISDMIFSHYLNNQTELSERIYN